MVHDAYPDFIAKIFPKPGKDFFAVVCVSRKNKMTDDEKRADIKKKLEQTNSDVVKFLLMMSTHYKRSIESVDELKGKELDYAMSAMQAKIDSMKEAK